MLKFIAGPMATLSHQGLRKIIEKFGGCDEYYTEMINASSYLTHGQFESFYTLNEIASDKIVWQITGKNFEPMAKCAKELCNFGGIGIDINMGCSAPDIVKTGAGIAWMLKPIEETKRLVCEVKNALLSFSTDDKNHSFYNKVPRLSVKLRLGDDNFTDEGFYNFCNMLYQNGVEQIVLHPRTKREKLARAPRYFYVENVAREFNGKMNVILNGNVKDVPSFESALKAAPSASGVMIARMSAQKPWIFARLKRAMGEGDVLRESELTSETSGTGIVADVALVATSTPMTCTQSPFVVSQEGVQKIDRLAVGLEYIQNLRTNQPPEFWLSRMQRFFAYYCDNFSYGHYIKSKMLNCKSLDDAEKTFSAYFEEVKVDRWENL